MKTKIILFVFLLAGVSVLGQNRTEFYNKRVDTLRSAPIKKLPFADTDYYTKTFCGYSSRNSQAGLESVKPENCYRIHIVEGDSLLGYVRCDGTILINNKTRLIEHLKRTAFYKSFMYEFGLLEYCQDH